MESLELVESQLNGQDTMNILKLLLNQYTGCVYLKVSNSCSRISSFIPKLDGVLAISLFHQKVTRREYLHFICNPIFNDTGVFINALHHTSQERNEFKNDTMRQVEAGDFIYSKVPVIVVPVNRSCFQLHCIANVSFSELGKLEFCTKQQILIRCNEFLMDFKYGSFSHHFLHDST